MVYGNPVSILAKKPRPKPYLTFSSDDGEFTLSVYNSTKNWDGALYYSTDTENWTAWDGTTAISSNGGKLYLRGKNNKHFNTLYASNCRFVFTGQNIHCSGNIENLLDYEIVSVGQHPVMQSNCFWCLFYQCDNLISAPELPATTLADGCYSQMFYGCTSLTNAPELPATTLMDATTVFAFHCYYQMFYGCTSLTNAPELPATALADTCYYQMFYGCTSLTNAPELPATTLARACYTQMFYGCTSLTNAPELPATTLVVECYYQMFYGCTSLKFSATQDSTYQYAYRIPTSGTGTGGTQSMEYMFSGTGGTFTGTPSINTTYYTDHPPVPAT